MSMARPLLALFIAALLRLSEQSHFEGGTISFRYISGSTVEFTWSQGWRLYTGPCGSGCSAASIGTLGTRSMGWWRCMSGCSVNLAAVTYTITGLNTAENWEQGQNSFQASVFSGNGPYTVGYSSCCWRSLNYGTGGNQVVQVTFTLGFRSDTGKVNTAPSTASSPIYRNQQGCGQTLNMIPMIDGDNDIVRCRWATGGECASVCNALPSSALVNNGNNCEITFNTNVAANNGWYAVAITLEDFPRTTITMGGVSKSTSTALSVVPLQFMIYTPSLSVSCGAVPYFVSPTPAANHQYSVLRGSTLTVQISAVPQSGYSISGISTSGPAGGITSSLTAIGSGTGVTWSWSPSSSQSGGYNLCFQAADQIGKVSSNRCVTVAIAVICPDPGTPANIVRSPSNSPTFYFGDIVTYSCATGYKYSSGSMTRTCQLNAAFDGTAPSCIQITCGAPAVGSNAHKASGTNYAWNQVTTFACNTGYRYSSGSSSRTCQSNGVWSGSNYVCTPVSCGNPGTPTNGAKSGTNYVFPNTVSFSCNTGYYRNTGSSSRTCQSSAAWSNTQPTCAKVRCPAAPTISFSTRSTNPVNSQWEYQDTVTYTAVTGYELKSGNTQRTCLSNAAWSGSQPTFGKVVCPTITPNRNVSQTGTSFLYQDVLTFACHSGYTPSSGASSITCQANRAWSGTKLFCIRITCPTILPNRNVTQVGYAYRYLDVITMSCNTGYEPDSGSASITCQASTSWSGTKLVCKRITCPTISPNRNVTQSGYAFRYLDVITMSCHSGYEWQSGSTSISCQSNRAWSGSQLVCKRITCPTVTPARNVSQAGFAYRYLDHIRMTCHTGYERDTGDYHIQCQANRAWNGTLLTCKRITCPTITPARNVSQTGFAYRYLDHIRMTCHTGYERDTGDYHIQCQANRAWNGTALTCKRITCPQPPPVLNSTQHGTGYRYLDILFWSCDIGYEIKNGSQARICQANRSWNATPPFCGRVECFNQSLPAHAAVVNSIYGSGIYPGHFRFFYLDSITYRCRTGYAKKYGEFYHKCNSSGLWNATNPDCQDINYCKNHRCLNGALCVDLISNYLCVCVWGFKGRYCQIPPPVTTLPVPNNPFNPGNNLYSSLATRTSSQLILALLLVNICLLMFESDRN